VSYECGKSKLALLYKRLQLWHFKVLVIRNCLDGLESDSMQMGGTRYGGRFHIHCLRTIRTGKCLFLLCGSDGRKGHEGTVTTFHLHSAAVAGIRYAMRNKNIAHLHSSIESPREA